VYVHLIGLLFWVTDSITWKKELSAQDLATYTWKIQLWRASKSSCPGSHANVEQLERYSTPQILRKQYSTGWRGDIKSARKVSDGHFGRVTEL